MPDLNRRGLLKLFGAGTTIAPLVAGKVVAPATARIITPPEVEIVEPKPVVAASEWSMLPDPNDKMICIYRTSDGHEAIFTADVVTTEVEVQWMEVRSVHHLWPEAIPKQKRLKWRLEGVCENNPEIMLTLAEKLPTAKKMWRDA